MPLVQTNLQILIIRHHKETKKRSNTARIASICVPTISIIQYPFDISKTAFDPSKDLLIYPVSKETMIPNLISKEARFQDIKNGKKTPRLIFLDGTWSQTRKLYRKTEGLHKIPWTVLSAHPKPPPKIRKSFFPNGMSTMECIGRAIGIFDNQDKELDLYKGLEIWVDAVRRNSGISFPLKSGESFSEVRIREANQNLE